MAAKRDPQPDPPAAASQSPAGAPREAAGVQEGYGPLRVQRLRKDDGRALILYAREQPDAR